MTTATVSRTTAPSTPATPSNAGVTALADATTRRNEAATRNAVTAPFGQIAIRLPDQTVQWSVEGNRLITKVDMSAVPAGKMPRLLLPDGNWAPAWMTLDRDTGIVSGVVPPSEGDASRYLAKVRVGTP